MMRPRAMIPSKRGLLRMAVSVGLFAALAAQGVAARETKRETPPADPDAMKAPVPNEPQQTSATFGDWVVRCSRDASGKSACETVQSLFIKGQPVAQIAFGPDAADKTAEPAILLTVLLPTSITFDKPPRLGASADQAQAAVLSFRRCIPAGCLANVKPDPALIKEYRTAQKAGTLAYSDAGDQPIVLPVSFRGLAQALDDLAKEKAKDARSR